MAVLSWENNRCFVCGPDSPVGLRVHFDGDRDGVVARCTVDPRWQGFEGIVHGGIIAGLVDDAMWHAIYHHGSVNTMTAELSVRYQKPVPIGELLHIAGRVTQFTRRLVVATATIVLESGGPVLVEAVGRFMPAKPAGPAG